MSTQIVMTIIGPDKPGMVQALARVVSQHGGNWLESRMAHLAGQFAGILRVAVEPARVQGMVAALEDLQQQGLTVVVQETADPPEAGGPRAVHLELAGSDHPGIVEHITEVIAGLGVNIEELTTQVSGTPMSGIPMFRASADLRIPEGLNPADLRSALEAVAADLMVDLSLADPTD